MRVCVCAPVCSGFVRNETMKPIVVIRKNLMGVIYFLSSWIFSMFIVFVVYFMFLLGYISLSRGSVLEVESRVWVSTVLAVCQE